MKFLKSNELEVGKYYQLHNKEQCKYNVVCKVRSEKINTEVAYWTWTPEIGNKFRNDDYLYVEISSHSFNRIKRYVLAKLDC